MAESVKADLAKGFTQHYFAEAVPCGTATKPPSTPIDNGKYKIVVETPPCIPPSPAPSAG